MDCTKAKFPWDISLLQGVHRASEPHARPTAKDVVKRFLTWIAGL